MDQQWMLGAVQLATFRWAARARRQLRDEGMRLGLDLREARLRLDMTEGRVLGRLSDLIFWYYPHTAPPGALYLVQQCPICRRPFPTRIRTEADVEAFQQTPRPECRPDPWTWARLRHRLAEGRATR